MGEIMLTIGVANHGPEQVFSHLHSVYGIDISEILQVPPRGNLTLTKNLAEYILFYTSKDLKRHLKYLARPKFKNKTIIVLGSCQSMFDIEGIVPLDYIDVDSNRFYDFELLDYFLPMPKEHSKLSKREVNYIDHLSTKVQNGSILTQLMTTIYTIPKSVNQKAITLGICDWFVNCGEDRDLIKFFDSNAKQYSVSTNVRGRLEEILLSDVAKGFKKAFKKLYKLRKSNQEVDNLVINGIADKHGVPAFEIRYITIKFENESLIKGGDKRSIDNLVDGKEK